MTYEEALTEWHKAVVLERDQEPEATEAARVILIAAGLLELVTRAQMHETHKTVRAEAMAEVKAALMAEAEGAQSAYESIEAFTETDRDLCHGVVHSVLLALGIDLEEKP